MIRQLAQDRLGHGLVERAQASGLNTTNASVMTNPAAVGDGDHTLFVCGNDAGAKARVTELVRSFGWRDVVDLGDITAARGAEMLLPLWLRLFGVLETPLFNFKVVR